MSAAPLHCASGRDPEASHSCGQAQPDYGAVTAAAQYIPACGRCEDGSTTADFLGGENAMDLSDPIPIISTSHR
jgi:hypothetical protein